MSVRTAPPRLLLVAAMLGAAIVPPPAHAQGRAIPVEKLMSAPFPSAMSAAPAGGLVAWVQNDRGVRNIWVAAPPEYRGRQLTTYAKDDGQDIGSLDWSPDASTIFYIRGGSANRAGDVANPTSDPAGAEQAIWRVAVSGGAPARVAAGSGMAISSGGLAFGRGGRIWLAPLDGAKEPAQLATVRGGAASLAWSPDGSKLAFVSNRGTHAFVGVLDVASKTVSWMQPSVDRDANPAWSPDGRRIAFLRTPANSRVGMFRPVRSARPWSIMVADVATGKATTAWTADTGRGSAFSGVVGEQLMWGEGDRLVFPWEKSGWKTLYAVSASGGRAVSLTPGEFEVEYAGLTPDRRHVLYNSNQGDIDRRDVWRVPVAGGPPVAVTKGADIEWQPVMTSDGRSIAFLRSGARRPAHAVIAVGGAAPRELAAGTIPADFPERQMVEPRAVTFTASDGMKIPAQLFLPPDLKPGEKRPAAIFFHGGSRRQMLLGWHYGSYYNNAYAMNQHLASKGYVVLSVNYRSGIGYGMEFREALNYGATGASEFNDVTGAGMYLAGRPDVDPRKIALWGGSYGGYLTAMGLARASDMFAAGVDFHGVHDWNVGIRTFQPTYSTLEHPEFARLALQSSPMAYIDGWRSPVLVIHGDDDRNVSFVETVTLVEALRERNVDVEQLVFPDEIHGFLMHSRWVEAYRASADFLDRKLKVREGAVADSR